MKRPLVLTSMICLALAASIVTGNTQEVFLDARTTVVCADSSFWVDVRVDSAVDSIHSFACLMYVDTSSVYLDSVTQGTIFDSVAQQHLVWFDWEYDDHYPDSLYFGGSIFDAGVFVDGPGQLGRIWFRTKAEGQSPVAFGWCVIRDPYHPSGPGMDVSPEDGQIVVLGPGIRYGDCNADDQVNIGDPIYILNYLFRNGPEPIPWLFVGSVDCDFTVDLGDAIYLLNYLFKNGPAPCDPCEDR
jgi:hypothetical protein